MSDTRNAPPPEPVDWDGAELPPLGRVIVDMSNRTLAMSARLDDTNKLAHEAALSATEAHAAVRVLQSDIKRMGTALEDVLSAVQAIAVTVGAESIPSVWTIGARGAAE